MCVQRYTGKTRRNLYYLEIITFSRDINVFDLIELNFNSSVQNKHDMKNCTKLMLIIGDTVNDRNETNLFKHKVKSSVLH